MHGRHPEPDQVRCPRCGAFVSGGSAYCSECGIPMRGQPHGAQRRESGRPPWVVPVFMVAAVAAVGTGVTLGMLLGGPATNDRGLAGATGSPTPEASATASTPTSSAPDRSPSPTVEPTATPTPAFGNLSILEVSTDGLNLRSQPGTASPVIGQLETGARLFTIGAPSEAEGDRWYRVAVVGGPYSECEAGFCPRDIGYVAEGIGGDEPYLAEASVLCPTSPMSAEALAQLHPLERLSCFGGNSIVVTGTIDYCYCDGPLVGEYEPMWLAVPVSQFLFHGTSGMWLRFEEGDSTPDDLSPGDIVQATVAMEHEEAPECSVSGPGDADLPSQAEVILDCRTQLVVEELTVTGNDPNVGS